MRHAHDILPMKCRNCRFSRVVAYLSCAAKLVLVFMLVNGSPSFSAWFCDNVIMTMSFLLQLLSTVLQIDVRARGVCEDNQEVLGHCFYVFTSYCEPRTHDTTLHQSSTTCTVRATSGSLRSTILPRTPRCTCPRSAAHRPRTCS